MIRQSSILSPRLAIFILAAFLSAAIASDLLWMPIQVSDSLGEMVDALESPSAWSSFMGSVGNDAYLRPLRIAQIKMLFDLSGGDHYWLVFRGFHALLLIVGVMLFVRALQVRSTIDAGAAAFALAVLVGLHTFRGTVQEAFPINHFLEMVVCCLAALNLAQARPRWWIDVIASLLFVCAALTLESGLLVWVVAAAAWIAGWRGISWRGVTTMTVLLVVYAYYRFVSAHTGLPTLAERSSGYLLSVLDPAELQRRFGASPLWFYGYNVVASALSVLFAEPQAGVFVGVRAWLDDRMLPRVTIPLATSLVTTVLIAWAAWRQIRGRRIDANRAFGDNGRMMVIFGAVLAGNAVLSFAYTKDEIMSIAGAFYALAAYGAMRELLQAMTHQALIRVAAATVVIGALAVGWSVRSLGVHYLLRAQAVRHQADWAELPGRWKRQGEWPGDPAEQRLILRLRADAIGVAYPNMRLGGPDWAGRLWSD